MHPSRTSGTGHVHRHGTRTIPPHHGTSSHRPSSHHAWLSKTSQPPGSTHALRSNTRTTPTTSLAVLRLELSPTDIASLRQRHEDGLPGNNLPIHLIDRPSRILRRREADESKPARYSRLDLAHHMGTCDGPHGREFFPQRIVVDGIIQILHVQVHALEFGNAIHLLGLILSAELALSL